MNIFTNTFLFVTSLLLLLDIADGQSQASMQDKWVINPDPSGGEGLEPTLVYDDYGFDFTYVVSNFIGTEQSNMMIYSKECRTGDADGNLGTIVTSGIESVAITQDVVNGGVTDPDLITASESISWKAVLDPLTFADNPIIYSSEAVGSAKIQFCLVFALETTGGTEVNFQETKVTLDIDLTDIETEFSISIDLTAKGKTTSANDVTYSSEAYICDPTTGLLVAGPSFEQGQVVDICIRPDATSRDNGGSGLVMNTINALSFTRGSTTQAAIVGGTLSDLGLSTHDSDNCLEKTFCSVSTILLASFYDTEGSVTGNGEASLKFLSRRDRDRYLTRGDRKEQVNRRRRSLQDDGGPTITSFDLDIDVVAADDGPMLAMAGGNSLTNTVSLIVMIGSVLITTVATILI